MLSKYDKDDWYCNSLHQNIYSCHQGICSVWHRNCNLAVCLMFYVSEMLKDDVSILCLFNLKFCVMISLSYNKMSKKKVIAFCVLNHATFVGFCGFLLATSQEVTYIFHKFIDFTNYFKSKYLVLLSWYCFLFVWNISPKRIILEK